MQYLSSFEALNSVQQPTVLFFDDSDDLPDLLEENLESIVRKARSSLGLNGLLNPVRGQVADKYFLTYAKYGPSGAASAKAAENTALAAVQYVGNTSVLISDPSLDTYKSMELLSGYPVRTRVLFPEAEITTVNAPTFEYIATYSQGGGSNVWSAASATGTDTKTITYSAPSSPPYGENRQRTSAPTFTVDGTTQPFLEYAFRVVDTGSGSANTFYSNSGDGLIYSPQVLEPEKTINLDRAYMFGSGFVMSLLPDKDYTVEQNLIPGSRPSIEFPSSSIDL